MDIRSTAQRRWKSWWSATFRDQAATGSIQPWTPASRSTESSWTRTASWTSRARQRRSSGPTGFWQPSFGGSLVLPRGGARSRATTTILDLNRMGLLFERGEALTSLDRLLDIVERTANEPATLRELWLEAPRTIPSAILSLPTGSCLRCTWLSESRKLLYYHVRDTGA